MKTKFFVFLVSIFSAVTLFAAGNPQVIMKTSMGTIELELFQDKAPVTVKNFLSYVDKGFYNGTIFHRVIENFMIQGGGMRPNMTEKPTMASIRNEAYNRVSNLRGTIAMARTMEVNSATSQFFINVVDNYFLDFKNSSPQGFGYCVFGKVTKGMDVVDRIKSVKTGNAGFHQNVPIQKVVIISIKRK